MKTIQADYSGKEHKMGCGCNKSEVEPIINYSTEGEYLPLNKRLVEYGKEVYGKELLAKFNITHMWIFTFYCEEAMNKCDDCIEKLSEMGRWISKYGFLEDPIKNIKWIIEDEPDKNLIIKDLHITKTPVHIITNGEGKIIDILYGFPDPQWLEKYILPFIRKDNI